MSDKKETKIDDPVTQKDIDRELIKKHDWKDVIKTIDMFKIKGRNS